MAQSPNQTTFLKANIRLGSSFVVQTTGTPIVVSELVITFPDLSYLKIGPTAWLPGVGDANMYNTIANIAMYPTPWRTNLKADLLKWLWNTADGDKIENVTFNQIVSAVNAGQFSYFSATGTPIPLSSLNFIDGVYKFVLNGNNGAVVTLDPTRVLSLYNAEQFLHDKIDAYMLLHADETATLADVDYLKDSLMKLQIISYACRYDFANRHFTEANDKVLALTQLISTGTYTFKPGH